MIYGVVSFFCPIVAVIAVLAYQSVAYADFWRSITPDKSTAGAMMAIGEVFQILVVSSGGCLLGICFAVASLRIQRQIRGVGLAALIFNGLPFLLLTFIWIKMMVLGR
ncbi:MAG: hypothetical protein ACYC7L_13925 [Nitrospirota bacterium]